MDGKEYEHAGLLAIFAQTTEDVERILLVLVNLNMIAAVAAMEPSVVRRRPIDGPNDAAPARRESSDAFSDLEEMAYRGSSAGLAPFRAEVRERSCSSQ